MKEYATTQDAVILFHEGSLAFAELTRNGMKVDMSYLTSKSKEVGDQIQDLVRRMESDKFYSKKWVKAFGPKAKISSAQQLGHILFEVEKYPVRKRTRTGRPKVDEAALSYVDLPFVRDYVEYQQLTKVKGTFLDGILREQVDGFVHPFYNLHIARSFRSSSDRPNLHNMPTRNPKMADVVRRAFIPRNPHWQFEEDDLSGIEVRVNACYNKDPNLIKYILDPTTDMHRDMACELFFLKPEEVSKGARYIGKNGFVFPSFYGSYYIQIAPAIWEELKRRNVMVEGKEETLFDRLQKNGIVRPGRCDPERDPTPGSFENHVRTVERNFWSKRFPVYDAWKKSWWDSYQRRGWFKLFTGFTIEGVHKKNDVINYPAQGAAFHILLEGLIRILKRHKKYKMKTLMVNQVHDSILGEGSPKELENHREMVREILTKEIPKEWKWIIVPIELETELAPVGKSWFEKKKV